MAKYYSTNRPIAPGSFPKPAGNAVIEICNFDCRQKVEGLNKEAWGWIKYKNKLTEQQAANYELVLDPIENTNPTKFEAIEDNAGGLHLFVFDNSGNVVYCHSGYEQEMGKLINDIAELCTGDLPVEDWDGNCNEYTNITPQEFYNQITQHEYKWNIVADNDGIYPEKMGVAAKREFGIK